MSKMTKFSAVSDIAVVDRGELGMDIINPNTGEKYCWLNAVGTVDLFLWLSQKVKTSAAWAKKRSLEGVEQWSEEEVTEG